MLTILLVIGVVDCVAFWWVRGGRIERETGRPNRIVVEWRIR